jgi:hypothetical protein
MAGRPARRRSGVPCQLERWPGASVPVGPPGHRGHEGEVFLCAAGHRRVQPLPEFVPGNHRKADADGQAMSVVRGDRISEPGVGEVAEREDSRRSGTRSSGRVPIHAAHHKNAVGGTGAPGGRMRWMLAIDAFAVTFGHRFPAAETR